ncbi:CTD kinase subunit gamma [Aspergillus saccharolyticus JOP 1030-1]|uniref:Sporulation protein n=1 Tax=Aspergillus saccharolyticus JOP 1030-1 TaxID=1450539 RepID=A0A318ZKD3_9EURO|nr:sporulation protein [Aspergillus saccharolyticus JOP 1030-1]PYH44240.1 sporulation protein [Aspergillus saccharolyticus JOP 1030-1]
MMVDPFEVRMRFTAQLQHLNASITSSQKAAHYALKYRDMDEDLHSCILEQLERNNMNNRANIMYFVEQFCEMATKEDHAPYVRMIQRDIIRIVDAVAPPDGSGAANVKHVRRVLNGLQSKEILSAATVAEIDAGLKERETHTAHLDLEGEEEGGGGEGGGVGATGAGGGGGGDARAKGATPRGARGRVDKRQIEQRIEEDRERNKRLRESMWTVSGDDGDEHGKFWDEASEIGEDDFLAAQEELMERNQMVQAR